MSILITGGTGFVGGALARALLVEGRSAVALLGRDFSRSGELVGLGAEAIRGDLRDFEGVVAACRGREVVFHVGALSSPWTRNPRDFYAVNVGGTEAVIAGCQHYGVRRLIYVSSPSVLSNGLDQEGLRDDAPFPIRFISEYSRTKKLGEDRVSAVRGEMETVILRPKAVFGPGDTSLLPRILAAARAGRLPQVGNGRNRMDLTYIDNVVHALRLAQDAPGAVGGTYAITNDSPVFLWDVIRRILRASAIPDRLRRIPLPLALAAASFMEMISRITGREPLLTRYTALLLARTQTLDISAAQQDLGYMPIVSVEEGIDRTLRGLAGS